MSAKNMNDYMKTRYLNRRAAAVEYLGGSCVECGRTDLLHFHHVDPENKLFTIAKGASFSEERFWNEVDKCVLLCDDCHKAHHKILVMCGTPQSYWRGCKCRECKDAFNEHHRDYKKQRASSIDGDAQDF